MEAYMWEKIHENYSSNIKVIGIGYADNKRQLDIFLKHKKIKFPVWYDKDKKFLKYYNIKTPKRIVINIDNKIMIIENPTGSKFFQDMFMTELFSLINSSNNL
jgi:peroxiredoxin